MTSLSRLESEIDEIELFSNAKERQSYDDLANLFSVELGRVWIALNLQPLLV